MQKTVLLVNIAQSNNGEMIYRNATDRTAVNPTLHSGFQTRKSRGERSAIRRPASLWIIVRLAISASEKKVRITG